ARTGRSRRRPGARTAGGDLPRGGRAVRMAGRLHLAHVRPRAVRARARWLRRRARHLARRAPRRPDLARPELQAGGGGAPRLPEAGGRTIGRGLGRAANGHTTPPRALEGAGVVRVNGVAFVDRPVRDVFDYVVDFARHVDWQGNVLFLDPLTQP